MDPLSVGTNLIVVIGGCVGVALYIEKKVQAVKENLTDFKMNLPSYLNGTYVRSAGIKVTGDEILRRLERVEERVEEME